ncbi:MAG TPA: response regulator [Chloroflexia bacterium]|nr:response regulator [Chloroflexia bacterium]
MAKVTEVAKVLIVDDEQSLLLLLQQIVEEQGHQVLMADNGYQALQIIENQQPVLVISDVMMPILDGYQLVEKIKSKPEWSWIKIVLISAAPINKTKAARADDFLAKPYDLDTIDEVLERFIPS